MFIPIREALELYGKSVDSGKNQPPSIYSTDLQEVSRVFTSHNFFNPTHQAERASCTETAPFLFSPFSPEDSEKLGLHPMAAVFEQSRRHFYGDVVDHAVTVDA